MTGPITGAELHALHALGYEWVELDSSPNGAVVKLYRAGFRDGSKSSGPRVFRDGDPEPGPEVQAVLDCDEEMWVRRGQAWSLGGVEERPWDRLLHPYGPLVACALLSPYRAALDADAKRHPVAESAGGVR